jgi:hypothetical protein
MPFHKTSNTLRLQNLYRQGAEPLPYIILQGLAQSAHGCRVQAPSFADAF